MDTSTLGNATELPSRRRARTDQAERYPGANTLPPPHGQDVAPYHPKTRTTAQNTPPWPYMKRKAARRYYQMAASNHLQGPFQDREVCHLCKAIYSHGASKEITMGYSAETLFPYSLLTASSALHIILQYYTTLERALFLIPHYFHINVR